MPPSAKHLEVVLHTIDRVKPAAQGNLSLPRLAPGTQSKLREILPEGEFVEVFVDASLEVCKERDPKGLYEKALRAEIKQFTRIDSPYEVPEHPELNIQAGSISVAEAVNQLLAYLDSSGALKSGYEPLKITA